MKKTLAALSVLGAFAGSALAADVTLYGVIDTGLVFQHADADMQGVDTVDTFQMKSGVTAGSRFGLKGTEDLGNGLKIGFVLENGFSSDTGSFTQDNRLFGREAQLNLSGLLPSAGWAVLRAATAPLACLAACRHSGPPGASMRPMPAP